MAEIYDSEWLDRAMRAADLRTGQLAKLSGVSRSQIQRIRGGMAPRMDTLRKLQNALGATGIAYPLVVEQLSQSPDGMKPAR